MSLLDSSGLLKKKLETARRWNKNNPEKRKEIQKKYYQNNKQKFKERYKLARAEEAKKKLNSTT